MTEHTDTEKTELDSKGYIRPQDVDMLKYTFTIIGIEPTMVKVLCEIGNQPPKIRYMMVGERIIYSPQLRIS